MNVSLPLRLTLAALMAWCFLSSELALASSLEISPVTVNLKPGQATQVIKITNRDTKLVAIQIRAFAWSQSDNADVLVSTKDVILSPPIVTIPAGAQQSIRVLLRKKAEPSERSYRLLIDEVPSAIGQSNQVGVALRISLPLISSGSTPLLRQLQWRARKGAGNEILLTAANKGNVYDRVHTISVTMPDGSFAKPSLSADNPYVLPGAQRSWVVNSARPIDTLKLSVTTQIGKTEHVLVVEP